MIHGFVALWSVTVAGLAARRQRSHFQSTAAREKLLSSTTGHTPEDGNSTPHRSAGGSSNPLETHSLEALVGELVARISQLIGKNSRGELTFKDILDHEMFINVRVQDSSKLREKLDRRQKLIMARMMPARRGQDIDKIKMSALSAQAKKYALLDDYSQVLLAEKDWLHATEGFKEMQRQLPGNLVKTAEDEDASAARAPQDGWGHLEDTTKQVSDGEDTKLTIMPVRLQSRAVSLFGSKLQAVAAPSPKRLQSNRVPCTQRAQSPAPMPPPLPPTQSGYALSPAGKPVVVEMFYDLICPFSSRMFKTVQDGVLPIFGDSVSFVMHQVPQPWHPQGIWVHEVALAVAAVSPASYPQYVRQVFEAYDAGAFKDEVTWDKTRPQVHEDLLNLAEGFYSIDVAKVRAMLQMKAGGGNAGNEVTQRIKWACKFHTARRVHVTPTVFVNGLQAGAVSIDWTVEEWQKFLAPKGEDFFTGSQL